MSPGERVFLFPGQSSRAPGMLAPLRARSPRRVDRVLERASDLLGRDLRALDASFETNRAVQVAVFLTNHLHALALADAGIEAVASAGMSLGEYDHLVHIGALSFEDALRLVDVRGALYDEGPPGTMAAVFPASRDELAAIVDDVGGEVWISNENGPTQHVVAGDAEAVARVCARAEDELYARATVIERRIPMHTPRFRPVAERFRPVLEAAPWRVPRAAHWSNVTATTTEAPSPAALTDAMTRHVCSPVRWHAQLEAMAARYPSATFVEVGHGRALHDLFRRSGIARRCLHTGTDDGWTTTLAVARGRTEAGRARA